MTGMLVLVGHMRLLRKVGSGSPFAGSGDVDRLARLCGLSSNAHLFERAWVIDAAATCPLVTDIAMMVKGRRVVLLGMKVAAAFGLHELPLLQWGDVVAHGSRFKAARCPHPNPINSWWADYGNHKRACAFLSRAVWV